MEIPSTQSWLTSLKAADRILKKSTAGQSAGSPSADFPLLPRSQTGLRGLEQTQSLEVHESKGRIIDRYL